MYYNCNPLSTKKFKNFDFFHIPLQNAPKIAQITVFCQLTASSTQKTRSKKRNRLIFALNAYTTEQLQDTPR